MHLWLGPMLLLEVEQLSLMAKPRKMACYPFAKPPLDYFRVGLKMFALALAQQSYFVPLLGLFGQKREVM